MVVGKEKIPRTQGKCHILKTGRGKGDHERTSE
jgi:hypothetical protein